MICSPKESTSKMLNVVQNIRAHSIFFKANLKANFLSFFFSFYYFVKIQQYKH